MEARTEPQARILTAARCEQSTRAGCASLVSIETEIPPGMPFKTSWPRGIEKITPR